MSDTIGISDRRLILGSTKSVSGSASDRSPVLRSTANSRGGAETGFGEPDTGRGLKEKRCSDVFLKRAESSHHGGRRKVPFFSGCRKTPELLDIKEQRPGGVKK